MNKNAMIAVSVLRLSLGWFLFYAGMEKILNPSWTAKSFLLGAKTFSNFYAWFALPMNTWWVDPLNAWGMLFIGFALILGVAVRPAAWAGGVLMILYYFPHYVFPEVPHGFIVEYHLIYAAAFIFIALFPPAHQFGVGDMMRRSFIGRIPIIKSLI